MNALESLSQYSQIVADTGDIEQISQWHPSDCTTNPSLILKAIQSGRYNHLLEEQIFKAKQQPLTPAEIAENLLVSFASQIAKQIPGRVSCEVEARFSFDTQAMLDQARRLIGKLNQAGLDKQRVLIKIAATWEGIGACRLLKQQGIECNMTLIFHPIQAIASAQARAYLISPFVGRILDWYQLRQQQPIGIEDDPGVGSVKAIYAHLKQQGYPTLVMAASFRNKQQILQLAGCDKLTIAPNLLAQLAQDQGPISPQLQPVDRPLPNDPAVTEEAFRWQLNSCAMSTEKLAEGIRLFNQDAEKLQTLIAEKVESLGD